MEETKIDTEKVNKAITTFVKLVNKGRIDDIEKYCDGEMTKKDIYEKYIDGIADGEKDGENIVEEEEFEKTEAKNVQREENECQDDEITLKDIYNSLEDIKKRVYKLETHDMFDKFKKQPPHSIPFINETRTWKKVEPQKESVIFTGGANPKRIIDYNGNAMIVDFSDLVNVINDIESGIKKKNEEEKIDTEKTKEDMEILNKKNEEMINQIKEQLIPGKNPENKKIVTRTYIFKQ